MAYNAAYCTPNPADDEHYASRYHLDRRLEDGSKDAVAASYVNSYDMEHQLSLAPPGGPPFPHDDADVDDEDDEIEPIQAGGGRTYSFGDRAVGFAGRMFHGGKMLFLQQRQRAAMTTEGPSLLRFLCFMGGLGMFLSSAISMVNVFSFLTNPSTYILQMYQGFFGIVTMVVEAKDWDCIDQLRPWMVQWFRFLTVPAGKGAFYIFVGSLGVSLWVRNLLSFTVGLYMTVLGLICVALHTGIHRFKAQQDEELQRRGHVALHSLMGPYDAVADSNTQNFFRSTDLGLEEEKTRPQTSNCRASGVPQQKRRSMHEPHLQPFKE